MEGKISYLRPQKSVDNMDFIKPVSSPGFISDIVSRRRMPKIAVRLGKLVGKSFQDSSIKNSKSAHVIKFVRLLLCKSPSPSKLLQFSH